MKIMNFAGQWQLIGGGPSRATDTFFNDKIQYGYYGDDYGGTGSADVLPQRNRNDPVSEDDFEKGTAGQRTVGERSISAGQEVWPRARFGSAGWGGTGNGGSVRSPLAFHGGQFEGLMFGGMMTRPCLSLGVMQNQQLEEGWPRDKLMLPNDLWGFKTADSGVGGEFTYLGGSERWIDLAHDSTTQVSFKWRKNPDLLFRNPDFLSKNPDFLLKNVDFITKHRWMSMF